MLEYAKDPQIGILSIVLENIVKPVHVLILQDKPKDTHAVNLSEEKEDENS